MKRFICFLLAFCILCSCSMSFASAVADENPTVSQLQLRVESFFGSTISLFARMWNSMCKTDETNIPAMQVRDHAWVEYNEDGFGLQPEMTLQAQTWVAVEVSFESSKQYADPFNDADVDLLLCGNGRLYTVPGFWDGGNVWKVRFVCPSAGTWHFKTVCTDETNKGLHLRSGKVECETYNGEYDIYKHGFVTTRHGEKYFTYDDVTPFFYLGDTHWSLGDETVDMVKVICEQREKQGFTVMQSEPIGATFDMANGITQDDMQGFAVYDEKFKIIADHGFVHANAQFFFPYFMEVLIVNNGGYSDAVMTGKIDGKTVSMHDLSDQAKQYLEKISRYWVARYGAYPVLWTLGQEVDNDFYWNDSTHPDWNFINNPYKLVAEYMDKYDAYDHPLTAHQENSGATAAYGDGKNAEEKLKVYRKGVSASCFRDVRAHDFYAAQWTPGKTGMSDFEVEKDYWYNSQGKPVVNYEGQYCYLWTKNFGARMQGWLAFLNGMYGYGWGGHDTWSYLNAFDEENDSSDGVDVITSAEKQAATWQDSLEYASSYQVGYMRNFLSQLDWYDLIPRFDNKSYFVPCLHVYYAYASTADNRQIVIYFYSFTDDSVAQNTNTKMKGGVLTGTVGNLQPDSEYTYEWFDPITGTVVESGTFVSSRIGTFFIGERPNDTDMVIRIQLKDSEVAQ